MPNFSTVEDTLFVPMLGRIYASKNFPHILNDQKALSLESMLPSNLKGQNTQTQYTLMASAVRSVNMDRYIADFIHRNPEGVVALLGCGLETTFYRNDNGKTPWFEIDLPDVIDYRKELLGDNTRDLTLPVDAFSEDWIRHIRSIYPKEPILVAASGLFYYFEKDKVIRLFKLLKKYAPIELLFDTVNAKGMKRMGKYMKQVGHEDAHMFFYVDDGLELSQDINGTLLKEEPYYAHIPRQGLKFTTSVSMKVSDKYNMVKMLHIAL